MVLRGMKKFNHDINFGRLSDSKRYDDWIPSERRLNRESSRRWKKFYYKVLVGRLPKSYWNNLSDRDKDSIIRFHNGGKVVGSFVDWIRLNYIPDSSSYRDDLLGELGTKN